MWGDDIGISHLSCYSDGPMGYQTPNIDRIAKDLPNYANKAEKQQTTMLVELHQTSITIMC
jgi:arylsulfatase